MNFISIKNKKQSSQLTDFAWYIFGTLIPILINLVKNPIFTRHFTAEEYGYYSLVFLTYNYIAIALFSWLSSTIWRYYYEYQEKNKLKTLFSNIGLIYLAGIVILSLLTITWYSLTELVLVKKLILFSFLYYIINDIISFYLVVIRLEKKPVEYNVLQSIRALINFLIVYILAFTLNFRIDAIAIGFCLSSFLVLVYIFYKTLTKYSFIIPSIRLFSKNILRVLFKYGFISLLSNTSALILTSSDRYFIALYHSIEDVGIYNQNYVIAQLSIASITAAFFNTINPNLNKKLTNINRETISFISRNTLVYIILLAPLTFYISIYAFEFNFILLGKDFRSGYNIIPYVVISLFLYGLALFPETKMKFADRYKVIIWGFSIACLINIVLNYFILRNNNYIWAAITTLIAYSFITIFFFMKDLEGFSHFLKAYRKALITILMVFAIQVVAHRLLKNSINTNSVFGWNLVEGSIFVFIYLLIAFKLGKQYKLFDK